MENEPGGFHFSIFFIFIECQPDSTVRRGRTPGHLLLPFGQFTLPHPTVNIHYQIKLAGAVCSHQTNELRDTGIPQGTLSCPLGNSPCVAPAESRPHV